MSNRIAFGLVIIEFFLFILCPYFWLSVVISIIFLALFTVIYYLPVKARKEHEEYMKDDRDITERFVDDEPFRNWFTKN